MKLITVSFRGKKTPDAIDKSKLALVSCLMTSCLLAAPLQAREYRSIDGSGNNQTFTQFGQAGVVLRKEIAPDAQREPGGQTYNQLKSARAISNIVNDQGNKQTCNAKGLSDLFWVWGQFLDHDITLVETARNKGSADPANILVPADDLHFPPGSEISFDRSHVVGQRDGRRFQANDITGLIDASNVYGSDADTARDLRIGRGGFLKVGADGLLPTDEEGSFLAGDVRANENAALTSMHTLWMLEHNRIAGALAFFHPDWDDEQLYQESRRWVAAEMQAITYNEFLPRLLGENAIFPYFGYQPNYVPEMINSFSVAAYRFGHSMLSPNLLLRNGNSRELLPLRNAFFNAASVRTHGIEAFLSGAATQVAQELDPMIIDDVRNFLFGQPGAGGFDLAALNIQRGRDHALPGYNDSRERMGLSKVNSFDSNIFRDEFKNALKQAYDHPDQADLWVASLAEKPVRDSLVGPSFQRLLVYQFESLRAGDRFWYEREFNEGEVDYLKALRLSDIIERNTRLSVQEHVMDASDPCQAAAAATTNAPSILRSLPRTPVAPTPQQSPLSPEQLEKMKKALQGGHLG